MRILVPVLILSAGLLYLMYKALCVWAQNDMRKAMYGEGQTSDDTTRIHSVRSELPRTIHQEHDNTSSPVDRRFA
jgi:hypothetical protein